MLDLDGVVYVGPDAVPEAAEALADVRAAGMSLAYVTNNAARPPSVVAAQLSALGVPAEPADVVTSAQAAAHVVQSAVGVGARVLVVGGEGLLEALRERELEAVTSSDDEPVAVVQGFHPTVGWAMLAEATYAINAGAVWVASNLDLTVPTARGVAPGNGTLVGVVRAAVGRDPDAVAGKPYRPLFDETVERVGAKCPIVVGDRLDTDIEGAHNAEADSLLVMTGVTDVQRLCRATTRQRPTYVAWNLRGLTSSHPEVVPGDAGWSCGEWSARVRDDVLDVTGPDGPDPAADGLRAAAVAAWAWADTNPDRSLDTSAASRRLEVSR
jgi:HAD superfamily hydrolase (TIGR01450 family)